MVGLLQRSDNQIRRQSPHQGWSCLHGNRTDSIRISNQDIAAAGGGSTGHPIRHGTVIRLPLDSETTRGMSLNSITVVPHTGRRPLQ